MVPCLQSVQAACPGASLYAPGVQGVQGPPVGPLDPASHTHSGVKGDSWQDVPLVAPSKELITRALKNLEYLMLS